ncbi:acyl-ACP desaturase [Streptomyces sp. CA-249302]|uniref:acyl-ACP desaturase n=1 Tax=Streptomyces sp. CA-249302 TaxID=3240058 RepID=UPI003D918350
MPTDLLRELLPVVEGNLDRHLRTAQEWMPHVYVPWDRGRDYVRNPWEREQSPYSAAVQAAVEINLLTEDNLPSYHLEIARRFGLDDAWGTWVHRWTAEEGRHAMALRDYLLVARGVDPDRLERQRMATVQCGYSAGDKSVPASLAYVSLQELATRISHRNTGRLGGDPGLEALLGRVAADENLHMIFYRSLVDAALEISPSDTVAAICQEIIDFRMPGTAVPGYRLKAMRVVGAGIYNLTIHLDDVVRPLIRHWRVFRRTDLNGEAEAARERLAATLRRLAADAERQAELFARGQDAGVSVPPPTSA